MSCLNFFQEQAVDIIRLCVCEKVETKIENPGFRGRGLPKVQQGATGGRNSVSIPNSLLTHQQPTAPAHSALEAGSHVCLKVRALTLCLQGPQTTEVYL